jgi:hypothetical protein
MGRIKIQVIRDDGEEKIVIKRLMTKNRNYAVELSRGQLDQLNKLTFGAWDSANTDFEHSHVL